MNSHRLESGGRIDRSRRLAFEFDGRQYYGFAGDTLASALLANGVRIIGRSFKLHRPRGLMAAWSEEPNGIVQIGSGATAVPNLKATQIELIDGLKARSVNCWPSARWDIFAFLGLFGRMMPAGFYYKTFKWPSWHWFEPVIRRAAGLGIAPIRPDPDRYEERFEHCDVLVVGAGPAGLAAALAATRAGARVVLCDDRPILGGSLQWEEKVIDGRPALEWVTAAERQLRTASNARVLTNTTAFGCYDHRLAALAERLGGQNREPLRERLWHVRAAQIVVASGAIERPIVFPENDVPGVMLASAATSYAVQYAVRPGRRAVVVTSTDSGYEAAEALRARGVEIAAIIDSRVEPGEITAGAKHTGIAVLAGHVPVRVHGTRAVKAIDVRPQSADAQGTGSSLRLGCDLICVSGGWTPTVHLFSQARGQLRYDPGRAALIPVTGLNGLQCAGAAAGNFALHQCLTDGFATGREAAKAAGARSDAGLAPIGIPERCAVTAFWACPQVRPRKSWVDFQSDVTRADLELAVRENLRSVEHVKRYTTTGMAVDQGKTSNMNALGILSELTKVPIAEIGPTTFRPPYDPVTLGTLAARHVGEFYHPQRRTPLDRQHAAHEAVFEDFGGWRRPAWYASHGRTRVECIRAEKRVTRGAVSLFDGSPLGKIEVRGPDAAVFLNRMYYNTMRTLAVGRIRYGLMLSEHGVIIDDGVCMRLADDHFLISTTSAGASRVFAGFEDWLQCEWPDLRVLVTNVTSAWGNIAVAGPRARELLSLLSTDIDLDRGSFPHLSIRCGTLEGVRIRMARVGFTGELSFELNVPAGYTASLWEHLLERGASLGVMPIGIEALQELRTEKGYIHVGTDTDGRTLPADIGMGEVLARKSDDFVGRRSLERTDATRADRLQFVGLEADGRNTVLPIGAHVVADAKRRTGSQGYVTSTCMSETLGRSIALGLVQAGRRRLGEAVQVYSDGRLYPARIVSPRWYDPEGERLSA
ncbi:MAG: sarcosine oxidase subunit alpha family protein [Steroidobacteraceae bacterium]